MGSKDSKPCCITYEDASTRVTEAELKRLRDAFRRASTLNGIITKQAFIKEVLGEGVPTKLAEHIFQTCGGTQKGITFRDLLCGLVLLTRGEQEEKIRFIFCLHANEAGTHVFKEDMVKLVQASEGGFIPEAVADCFVDSEKVTFDEFRNWLLNHRDATSLTRWLLQEPCSVTLSNDTETPTFYQTLAGVTHLEEADIVELEKRYWALKGHSRTGKFDLETLVPLISPAIPPSLCEGFFNAFDENRDGHIDFKEMACGISAACRGPVAERQKFCFKIFDRDRDGLLSRSELEKMVEALLLVRKENRIHDELEADRMKNADLKGVVNDILSVHDSNKDGSLTLDEYLVWTVDHPLPLDFLNLLFQICHVVLGLRPATKEEEGEIIRGWLEREERRGMQVGHFWYLVSMEWWKSWHEYINYQPTPSADSGICSSSSSSSSSNGSTATSSSASPASSLNGSLKRTKLQKKASVTEGSVARCSDDNNVVITSMTALVGEEAACTVLMAGDNEGVALPTRQLNSTGGIARPSPLTLPQGVPSSPKKISSVLCAVGGGDLSRCSSATPSPTHSPRANRKPAYGTVVPPLPTPLPPQRPGAIDNSSLIIPNVHKVMTLTGEGGKLKRNTVLIRGRDFELVPDPVWIALFQWYGGTPALPRQVILPKNSETPELELYPICLRLLRHHIPATRTAPSAWPGMVGGYGTTALGATAYSYTPQTPLVPKRYLAYTASFSRLALLKQVCDFLSIRLRIRPEDMRLWNFKDENNMTLLEEEYVTLEELGFEDNEQLLIEVKNKDQTWPEEMTLIASRNNRPDRKKLVPTEKGATGLNNLGNTCFMNAALQCVSNTRPLTQYFTLNMHLYELNRINPHGMKGHIAKRYGDLVQELWGGVSRTIAPLKLRWTIGKYAPRFNGFQQHDSQELLAFLLDGLHEDLNRVHDKPYVELKDSDGRSDVIVAQEAWENHILRNKSIIVDLFHGQLKSCVRCKVCGHESVRFDPFNYLSLPLPMESCIHVEVVVFRIDGCVPYKYGLRLNMDEKYRTMKQHLSVLCGVSSDQLMLAEIVGSMIKSIPPDDQKIKTMMVGQLYAYEVPLPSNSCLLMEDQHLARTKEPQTLTQIQRMTLGDDFSAFDGDTCSTTTCESEAGTMLLASVSGCINRVYKGIDSVIWERRRQSTPGESGNNSVQSKRPKTENNIQNTSPSEPHYQQNSEMADGDSLPPILPLMEGIGTFSQRSVSSCSTANSSMTSSMTSNSSQPDLTENFSGFVIAYHRKMIRQDVYFLSSQKSRVSLFGMPLVIPCSHATTHQHLYQAVWIQVSRLVSPLPPSEANVPNHAQDCDDSLGYEYPFTLKAVQRDGTMCAWCPWHRFCRGCKIECSDTDFKPRTNFLAIDWDPTALHLRYQASQERVFHDDRSVENTCRLQSQPIDLDTCLQAFTKEEELGEDEKYYCSKCKLHQLASKKLQIWRLPPILIIHLKRFQFVNGRWVKSQKIVKFPFEDFDPTNYLAFIPKQTAQLQKIARNKLVNGNNNGNGVPLADAEIDTLDAESTNGAPLKINKPQNNVTCKPMANGSATILRDCSDGQSVVSHGCILGPLVCDTPQDFHQHRLKEGNDPYDLKYQLYAISSHSGILGGGHYICYACNPNHRWYCYNDSSCKELSADQIDSDSAYMLFYERDGIDYERYLPNVDGKLPDTRDIDDEFESDFKKMCCLQ